MFFLCLVYEIENWRGIPSFGYNPLKPTEVPTVFCDFDVCFFSKGNLTIGSSYEVRMYVFRCLILIMLFLHQNSISLCLRIVWFWWRIFCNACSSHRSHIWHRMAAYQYHPIKFSLNWSHRLRYAENNTNFPSYML